MQATGAAAGCGFVKTARKYNIKFAIAKKKEN